ncbi:MAG: hypothetical protein ACRD4Q_04300, partial [Candidatus Acidiferrales bacterium]
ITVHDNQLSAPGYNAIAGIGIVYTQNAVVSRNIITGYYSGIEIWGGDANANGGILNTRWDKNITLSANIGYANGAAGSNGGVFWTSMCEGCTETGNISYGAGDVGIDNEGSFAVSASGNYVYGAYHAAYGQFFYSRDITWSGNTAIMTAPTQACFEVWNGAQDLTPFDLNFSGNNCWNQGTGIASAGTINGSVDDLRMSANNFRNVALDLSSTNMHRALIEGNVFTFTQSHAGPLYAILASGFNATDAGGSHLSIAHNQIFSDAAQPSGSAAIYISHGDPNEPMRVSITGNDISGSSPFPTDVALHESSTNLQAIYAKIEMNTFAVPLVTKTIDSGNGAINTYYLGNVSLALTSYTGP